jgi:hypothetical protein
MHSHTAVLLSVRCLPTCLPCRAASTRGCSRRRPARCATHSAATCEQQQDGERAHSAGVQVFVGCKQAGRMAWPSNVHACSMLLIHFTRGCQAAQPAPVRCVVLCATSPCGVRMPACGSSCLASRSTTHAMAACTQAAALPSVHPRTHDCVACAAMSKGQFLWVASWSVARATRASLVHVLGHHRLVRDACACVCNISRLSHACRV